MHQGQGARLQWHPPQSSPETHLTACTGGEDDFPGPPSGGDGSVKTLGGILNKETEAQNGFGFVVLGSRTQNSKKSVPSSTEHTFCSFLLNIRLRSEKKEDTDLNYIANSQSSFCASFDSSHGAVASCLSHACLPISPLPLETVSSCLSPHLAQKTHFQTITGIMDTQMKDSQQEIYTFFFDQASFNMDMIPSFWSHVGPWKREPEEKHS